MWSNLIFGQIRDFSVVLILSSIPDTLTHYLSITKINSIIEYFTINTDYFTKHTEYFVINTESYTTPINTYKNTVKI